MADAALAALVETVRAAAAARRPLAIRGGGTKDFYGGASEGDVVSTIGLAGIVDYAPGELVVTARAGTPLADVENALAAEGQMLAFEPPRFAAGGTLGGAIASGLSGPRRPYAGAARDGVLGVRVVDGTGEALAFGGRVMKNVAGFDVARLMTGALGTLGILTEVSLKCLPRPKVEATLAFELAAGEAIDRVNAWSGKPLPLSATCWHAGRLCVRLSGAPTAVASAQRAMGGEAVDDDDAPWRALRDHAHPFFAQARADGRSLWRLSLRSTAPPPPSADALIEWGGALRWIALPAGSDPAPLQAHAREHGGHATLFRAGEGRAAAPFAPLDATTLGLHARLKATFDPQRILNRGRLHPEL